MWVCHQHKQERTAGAVAGFKDESGLETLGTSHAPPGGDVS